MKKGTKIITTAISLVLVLSFMVVGILAATSATAGISASISWTAEKGVAFTIDAWTWQSAEHYDENSKSFPEISSHKIEQIVVDTATTNQQASGISKSLNANFIDITDDGVNNPLELYYIYKVYSLMGLESSLSVYISFPQSTDEVSVEYGVATKYRAVGYGVDQLGIDKYSTGNSFRNDQTVEEIVAVKLTLKNPDVSVSNFNANVLIDVSMGVPNMWG